MTADEYERRYAADMRHEAMIEAVAQALMDTCYGGGSWASITSRPEGAGQRMAFLMQARAAARVFEQWTNSQG